MDLVTGMMQHSKEKNSRFWIGDWIPHRIRGHRLQREDKCCFSMRFGTSVESWLDPLQTWSLLGTQLEPISKPGSKGQMRPAG